MSFDVMRLFKSGPCTASGADNNHLCLMLYSIKYRINKPILKCTEFVTLTSQTKAHIYT